MDSALDALIGIIQRAGDSWLGMVAVTSPIWLLAAVRTTQSLRRRRGIQGFAAAQRLQFAGTIPSDARAPYTRIERVRWAVLLTNVVEGQWDGLPIRVFDMSPSRRAAPWTTILVTVEGTLRRGAHAEGTLAGRPEALIETNLDVLSVSPMRRLDAAELPTWLSFATALAKAMERDAREQPPTEPPVDEPPPDRSVFGLSRA